MLKCLPACLSKRPDGYSPAKLVVTVVASVDLAPYITRVSKTQDIFRYSDMTSKQSGH